MHMKKMINLRNLYLLQKNYYDFKGSACNITLIKRFSKEDWYSQTILVQVNNTCSQNVISLKPRKKLFTLKNDISMKILTRILHIILLWNNNWL